MYRPSNYMPLGFAAAQDGSILETNQSQRYSNYPLDGQTGYVGASPTSTYATQRPATERSSSTSTLLGEDNYFSSPVPGTPYTTRSYSKGDNGGKDFGRYFKHWKQFFRLLGAGFLRFLISAGLIAALYELIWWYSSFALLNTSQKRMFNFLVTALSLALGLNLASSLKSIAIKSRWWILSWEKRPLEDVEAILSSHSLTTVIELGCKSMLKKPSVTMGCFLWLLINIAVQAFVAALGLNWSIVSAIDPSSHVPGTVVYSNLTQFYFGNNYQSSSADQITAHLYGEISVSQYNWDSSNSDIPGRLPIIEPLTLYKNNQTEIWDFDTYTQYVFMDVPAANDSQIGAFYTNRSIWSESQCNVAPEKVTLATDGTNTVIMQNITLQSNSTTYFAIPGEDGTDKGCGDRCANVYALENDGTNGYYYTCNVTVSNVTNTTRWSQQLPDNLARMAAMSIALTGYNYDKTADALQAQAFYHDFIYGTYLGGNSTSMEWLLRVFAIATVVSADRYNPYVQDGIPGDLPSQGVSLTLDHPGFIEAILLGIGGFHFLLFILAVYFANKAIVIDDSYLAISMQLNPVIEKLGGHGSLLKKKDICEALGNPDVAYGVVVRQPSNGVTRHLEISEVTGKPPGGWKGRYD